MLEVKAQSDINYSSDYNEHLKKVIDKLISNLDEAKRLKYKSYNFGKTNYKNDNNIVNIICKAYPKNSIKI